MKFLYLLIIYFYTVSAKYLPNDGLPTPRVYNSEFRGLPEEYIVKNRNDLSSDDKNILEIHRQRIQNILREQHNLERKIEQEKSKQLAEERKLHRKIRREQVKLREKYEEERKTHQESEYELQEKLKHEEFNLREKVNQQLLNYRINKESEQRNLERESRKLQEKLEVEKRCQVEEYKRLGIKPNQVKKNPPQTNQGEVTIQKPQKNQGQNEQGPGKPIKTKDINQQILKMKALGTKINNKIIQLDDKIAELKIIGTIESVNGRIKLEKQKVFLLAVLQFLDGRVSLYFEKNSSFNDRQSVSEIGFPARRIKTNDEISLAVHRPGLPIANNNDEVSSDVRPIGWKPPPNNDEISSDVPLTTSGNQLPEIADFTGSIGSMGSTGSTGSTGSPGSRGSTGSSGSIRSTRATVDLYNGNDLSSDDRTKKWYSQRGNDKSKTANNRGRISDDVSSDDRSKGIRSHAPGSTYKPNAISDDASSDDKSKSLGTSINNSAGTLSKASFNIVTDSVYSKGSNKKVSYGQNGGPSKAPGSSRNNEVSSGVTVLIDPLTASSSDVLVTVKSPYNSRTHPVSTTGNSKTIDTASTTAIESFVPVNGSSTAEATANAISTDSNDSRARSGLNIYSDITNSANYISPKTPKTTLYITTSEFTLNAETQIIDTNSNATTEVEITTVTAPNLISDTKTDGTIYAVTSGTDVVSVPVVTASLVPDTATTSGSNFVNDIVETINLTSSDVSLLKEAGAMVAFANITL